MDIDDEAEQEHEQMDEVLPQDSPVSSPSIAPLIPTTNVMDTDEIPNLQFVPDDFGEGEHERLDADIRRTFPVLSPGILPLILWWIVKQSATYYLAKYRNPDNCETLLDSNPAIRNMLVDGWQNGFKNVRLLKLLRQEQVLSNVEPSKGSLATEFGWEAKFVGDAEDALWDHVQTWFDKPSQSDPGRGFYAKYCAIVQSSGMGKSRVVDEMSKSRFVIPVNLRTPTESGFPPGDASAHYYLIESGSQRDAFLRSCAFLHALFSQTADVVKGFREGRSAAMFREYMTDGMKHHTHGERRTKFFESVQTKAQLDHYDTYNGYFPAQWLSPSHDHMDGLLSSTGFPLHAAFQTLLDALHVGKSRSSDRPYVVLAFDEVHTLTEVSSLDNNRWSRFGEVRRAIRGLLNEPLFTLFLSTSGTLFSITPSPDRDPSGRVMSVGEVMLPFYELGFDQLAKRLDHSSQVTLQQVTSDAHLTSYGRPLWRHYYEFPHQEGIIPFAAYKLLGGTNYVMQDLTDEQKLACLAQRVPIEFLSALYLSQISDKEKEQVNSHMRVVLKIGGLEAMVTMSPSEPVLSEAAYYIMSTSRNFNPAQALQKILDGFLVNKGELGELITVLLFTIARDKAVGPAARSSGSPSTGQRWCSITGLMGSLFRTPDIASNSHVDVNASHGWSFTRKRAKRLNRSLADQFKNSKVYFTHFIKVHQHAIVQVDYLMRLMARGAAILCGNNQRSMDGIIPFLFDGDEIRPGNIGVILFQVKNDRTYNKPIVQRVHDMDPRGFGVISPSADIPVIRLFFSLAANTPALELVHHTTSSRVANSYHSYDFWVSGLSPKILVPVMDGETAWESILQASSDWKTIYKGGTRHSERLRKSMNPGVALDEEFWENWFPL